MLPMAHMYGLAFEFLYEFSVGCHIYYLTRMPSPKIIFQAFADIKPNLIVAVPLIIEKIIKKSVLPKLETPTMKLLLKVPIINDKIKATVREQMVQYSAAILPQSLSAVRHSIRRWNSSCA